MTDSLPMMYFIGVSTSKSSVNQVFDKWADILNRKVSLKGIDIPIDADKDTYIKIITEIKSNKNVLGALVTTHKAKIFEYTADLFDELEQSSSSLKEIGTIYKRDGKLFGAASDHIAMQRVLTELIPDNHWGKTKGDALIIGSGGAGIALAYTLLSENNGPNKIIMTEIEKKRIPIVQSILSPFDKKSRLKIFSVESITNDSFLCNMHSGSLLVNATGMGKDRPGSPISKSVEFPEGSIVWELNYRGNLQFLDVAKSQMQKRYLRVEDGWSCFIHGWCTVMSKVFDVKINNSTIESFRDAANTIKLKTSHH